MFCFNFYLSVLQMLGYNMGWKDLFFWCMIARSTQKRFRGTSYTLYLSSPTWNSRWVSCRLSFSVFACEKVLRNNCAYYLFHCILLFPTSLVVRQQLQNITGCCYNSRMSLWVNFFGNTLIARVVSTTLPSAFMPARWRKKLCLQVKVISVNQANWNHTATLWMSIPQKCAQEVQLK